MGKLFVFAVGGSGSRVLKSLVMLLASGVKINASEIIPIIVDPHKNNEDLKRTETLLSNYKKINELLEPNRSQGFFKTKITTLKDLAANEGNLESSFSFSLKNVKNERFKDYIDFSTLDESNKALASLLFSESNLDIEMDIGFVGNPNIGSVVVNQFKDSAEFRHFASNFDAKDRVFIISSIFGGTGAAGFPIILKNIRNAQSGLLDNHAILREAKVGAVTILPYFGIEPGRENRIKKADFFSKTKAALSYYEGTINDSVNALYYIGDDKTRDYTHDPGENGQKNDAHFVELVSALAIIDFANASDAELGSSIVYKDFGIMKDTDKVTIPTLSSKTQKIIAKPLSQYALFVLFLKKYFEGTIDKGRPFAERKSPKIDSSFISSSFYQTHLNYINRSFEEWLMEMARNKRAFVPFELNTAKLSEIINGVDTKKGLFGSKQFDHKDFESALNTAEKGNSYAIVEQKFMNIFHSATESLLREYFPNEYFD